MFATTNSQYITARDYTEKLYTIGKLFLSLFKKRSHTLPLHIQIVCGQLSLPDIEKILLAKPHLVNACDDYGRTPIMIKWHTGLYKTLLIHGANPNHYDNDGNTVLMYHREDIEIVKLLLSYNADINHKNNNGISLITMALEDGLPIQPLLDAGAVWQPIDHKKIDKIFRNCLEHEDIEILAKIVADGLPSEEVYHYAKVWSACYDQHKFDWLITFENQYSLTNRKQLSTEEKQLFFDALRAHLSDETEDYFIQLIKNIKRCLDSQDSLSSYLTHWEITGSGALDFVKNQHILKVLLEAGCNPDANRIWLDNTDISSPLYKAVKRQDEQSVQLLLLYGANPNTGTSYMDIDETAVSCSICNNNLTILKMLIEAGADLNFTLRSDRTPLITAIKRDNINALKMLIDAGANPKLVDEYGRTPSDYLCSERNSINLISYMESIVNV